MANPYLKDLLALSTAATAQAKENLASEEEVQNEPSNGNPLGLSDERMEWLKSALNGLANDTDVSKILAGVMKELHEFANSSAAEVDEEKVVNKAYELEDLLSYADLAPQFINSAGIRMIRHFLENHLEPVQEVFAQCILTFTENNPPAQNAVIQQGLLQYVLEQLSSNPSQKMRLKYLGAVSGTARSDENAFKGFLDLNGRKVLSDLVKGDDVEVGVKAARVLTSIAYTLQDSAEYAKSLIPDIVGNYKIVASKSRGDDNNAELEYIRDFFDQYVPKELLNEEDRELILAGLRTELQYKDDANVQRLVDRYA